MRVFRVLAVLTVSAAGSLAAQLAAPQPTEKLLILPFAVANAADSAASIATTDAARARLISIARYKVNVIAKQKICEVLAQSGFACDVLITAQQAEQLSKALGINSYTSGLVTHEGNLYVAKVHVVSGASGFASTFKLNGAATPAALGEAIAQRLANIVKAAESARNCNEQRSHSALDRALGEARKAFTVEPDLAEAWICIATVYELRHQTDSMIYAYHGALKGDSSNTSAWNRISNLMMVKGDTAGAMSVYYQQLMHNPTDKQLRLALATQYQQRKQYDTSMILISGGLKLSPGDQSFLETRRRVAQDGSTNATDNSMKKAMSDTLLAILKQEAATDTSKLADTNNLKLAIGTAGAVNDTADFVWWTRAAVRHYPNSLPFIKQLAGAYLMAGQNDSAIAYYRKALVKDSADVRTSLLIASTMISNAVWDTAAARRLQASHDSAALRRMREPFAAQLDEARPFLALGFASRDSSIRLNTAQFAYTGGAKLVQAGASDRALPWLEPAFDLVADDTTPARQNLRSSLGYFYGLSLFNTVVPLLQQIQSSKKCTQGPLANDRIQKSKKALTLGARIAPQQVRPYLENIPKFEEFMGQVRKAFKCTNF